MARLKQFKPAEDVLVISEEQDVYDLSPIRSTRMPDFAAASRVSESQPIMVVQGSESGGLAPEILCVANRLLALSPDTCGA